MRRLPAALAIVLLPLVADADEVTFNGRVKIVRTVNPCPSFQYEVEGMPVLLSSATIDLAQHVGNVVSITGEHQPPYVFCALSTIDVTAITPAPATLGSCGTPRPGCPMRFEVGPPTISINSLWASLGSEVFAALDPPLGALAISPPIVFLGTHGPAGFLEITLPNQLALVGVTLAVQGHHQDVGPIQGPGSLTNPLRFTLLPQGPLCIDPSSC